MIRQPVSSTNIRSVGYDSTTRTLEIEFNRRPSTGTMASPSMSTRDS